MERGLGKIYNTKYTPFKFKFSNKQLFAISTLCREERRVTIESWDVGSCERLARTNRPNTPTQFILSFNVTVYISNTTLMPSHMQNMHIAGYILNKFQIACIHTIHIVFRIFHTVHCTMCTFLGYIFQDAHLAGKHTSVSNDWMYCRMQTMQEHNRQTPTRFIITCIEHAQISITTFMHFDQLMMTTHC